MGAGSSVEDPASDRLLLELLERKEYMFGGETLDLSREIGFEEFLAHSSAAFGGGSGVGVTAKEEVRDAAVKSLPSKLFEKGIANLSSVKTLLLDFQALSSLEPRNKIAQFVNLERLSVRYNFLTSVPSELGSLQHLQYVDLQNNSLTQLPREIASLASLTVLNLANNRLESLPDCLGGPKCVLRKLNVSHNYLFSLPLNLGNTPTLQVVLAVINKSQDPPQEIANQGSNVLIAALRERYQTKTGKAPLPQVSSHSASVPSLPLISQVWSHSPSSTCFCAPLAVSPDKPCAWVKVSSLPLHVLKDRIAGCFFGSVLGDAIGVATEFMDLDQAAFFYDPPLHYRDIVKDRHRVKFRRGHFTDDTYQSLCLLHAFLNNSAVSPAGTFDPAQAGERIATWAEKGFPWLGDTAGWGLGATVGKVISHSEFAKNPHAAAKAVYEGSHGAALANGAVMRTAIVGVVAGFDSPCMPLSSSSSTNTAAAVTASKVLENNDPSTSSASSSASSSSYKLIEDTISACRVTHYAPECVASCLAITAAIAVILKGEFNPENSVSEQKERGDMKAAAAVEEGSVKEREFARLLRHCFDVARLHANLDDKQETECWKYLSASSWSVLALSEPKTIGYTYKAMGAAFVGLRRCVLDGQDFATVLTELTMEAGDADTNGVVMGAVVGAYLGYFKLPQEWIEGLVHRSYLECMLHQTCCMLGVAS